MGKRVALYGSLTALALIFGYIESLVPLTFIPVAGVKIGLANAVILLALLTLQVREALLIAVARILLSGFLFGNPSALLYALFGGLLSFTAMALLSRFTAVGCVGISVVGGIMHNIGQVIAAFFVTGTVQIFGYLSVLIPVGAAAGAFIGTLVRLLVGRVKGLLQSL